VAAGCSAVFAIAACNVILGTPEAVMRNDGDGSAGATPDSGPGHVTTTDGGANPPPDAAHAIPDSSVLADAAPDADAAPAVDAAPFSTCDGGTCVTLLARDQPNPRSVAVDPGSDGYVYFTNWAFSDQLGNYAAVWAAPKDGSSVGHKFPFQGDYGPAGQQYDPRPNLIVRTSTQVCWTVFSVWDTSGGAVDCADNTGAYHEYGGYSSPYGFPLGIAADGPAVFFANRYSLDLGTVSSKAPNGALLKPSPPLPELVDAGGNLLPGWIAVTPDASGTPGRVFWDDGAHLLSSAKDGSDTYALPGAPKAPGAKVDGAIAVDSDWIYWMETQVDGSSILYKELNTAGRVPTGWSCPGYGDCPVKLAGGDDDALLPGNLVIDNGFLYWPNFTRGTVKRIRTDGSASVETVVQGVPSVTSIAIDDVAVYFARSYTNAQGGVGSGTVGKVLK
jgi:hypothetical protein